MEYGLLEEKVTVITVKDLLTGATLAYECETKGLGDTWVILQLARDINDWGREHICVKTDGESSIVAVQRALAAVRTGRTVPEFIRDPNSVQRGRGEACPGRDGPYERTSRSSLPKASEGHGLASLSERESASLPQNLERRCV